MSRHNRHPDALLAYRGEPLPAYTLPRWLVALMLAFAAACPVLVFTLGA
jgi:hypothetical protein